MEKYVYNFQEGNENMKDLLGGKGANLACMKNLGLPVPDGFTITTEACNEFYNNNGNLPSKIKDEVISHIKALEARVAKYFGNAKQPLLVSVRSGARSSMPGMMDTILNLGLNDAV